MADITSTGPVGLPGLQGLNKTQGKYDANSILSSYKTAAMSLSNPLYSENVDTGLDEWRKDRTEVNNTELQRLGDLRAMDQSGAAQIANGIAKGVVTTGTTFLNDTVGAVAGLVALVDGDDDTNYWDNPFSRAMKSVSDWSERAMPNFYSDYEQEHPFMISANFIGDKVIKNLGFTAGSMLAASTMGNAIAGQIGKVAKATTQNAINKANRLVSSIEKAEDVADAARKAELAAQKLETVNKIKNLMNADQNVPKFVTEVAASLYGALGEGAFEALNNSDDRAKLLYQQMEDELAPQARAIENEYRANMGKSLVFNQETGKAIDPAYEKYKQQMQALEDVRQQKIQSIKENTTRMGNMDLALNIPILTASNIIQFGKMLGGGFKGASSVASKNASRFAGMDMREAWGIARKEGMGAREFWAEYAKFNTTKTIGKEWMKQIGDGLSEGVEELTQGIASEWSGRTAQKQLDREFEYIDAGKDPNEANKNVSWLSDAASTFMASTGDKLKDKEAWSEFFVGALTGLLGAPAVGAAARNADIHTTIGGNKETGEGGLTIGWGGGLLGMMGRRQEIQEEQELIDQLNNTLQSDTFQNLFNGKVRHDFYDKLKHNAALTEDEVAYDDADVKQMVGDIITLQKAGRLDILEAALDGVYDTSDDNVDVVSKQFEEAGLYLGDNKLAKEETVRIMNQNRAAFQQVINDARKSSALVDNMANQAGVELTPDQKENLVFMHMASSQFAQKANQISYDTANIFSVYSTQIEPITKIAETEIEELSKIDEKDRTDEQKTQLAIAQNLVQLNRNFLTLRDNCNPIRRESAYSALTAIALADNQAMMDAFEKSLNDTLDYAEKTLGHQDMMDEAKANVNRIKENAKKSRQWLDDFNKIAADKQTLQQHKEKQSVRKKIKDAVQNKHAQRKAVNDISSKIKWDGTDEDLAKSITANKAAIDAMGGYKAWRETLSGDQKKRADKVYIKQTAENNAIEKAVNFNGDKNGIDQKQAAVLELAQQVAAEMADIEGAPSSLIELASSIEFGRDFDDRLERAASIAAAQGNQFAPVAGQAVEIMRKMIDKNGALTKLIAHEESVLSDEIAKGIEYASTHSTDPMNEEQAGTVVTPDENAEKGGTVKTPTDDGKSKVDTPPIRKIPAGQSAKDGVEPLPVHEKMAGLVGKVPVIDDRSAADLMKTQRTPVDDAGNTITADSEKGQKILDIIHDRIANEVKLANKEGRDIDYDNIEEKITEALEDEDIYLVNNDDDAKLLKWLLGNIVMEGVAGTADDKYKTYSNFLKSYGLTALDDKAKEISGITDKTDEKIPNEQLDDSQIKEQPDSAESFPGDTDGGNAVDQLPTDGDVKNARDNATDSEESHQISFYREQYAQRPQISTHALVKGHMAEKYSDALGDTVDYPAGITSDKKEAYHKYVTAVVDMLLEKDGDNKNADDYRREMIAKQRKERAPQKIAIRKIAGSETAAGVPVVGIYDSDGHLVGTIASELDFDIQQNTPGKEHGRTLRENNPQLVNLYNSCVNGAEYESTTNEVFGGRMAFTDRETSISDLFGSQVPSFGVLTYDKQRDTVVMAKSNNTETWLPIDDAKAGVTFVGIRDSEGVLHPAALHGTPLSSISTSEEYFDNMKKSVESLASVFGTYDGYGDPHTTARKDRVGVKTIQAFRDALITTYGKNCRVVTMSKDRYAETKDEREMVYPTYQLKERDKKPENIQKTRDIRLRLYRRKGHDKNFLIPNGGKGGHDHSPVSIYTVDALQIEFLDKSGRTISFMIDASSTFDSIDRQIKKAFEGEELKTTVDKSRLQDESYRKMVSKYMSANVAYPETVNDWFTFKMPSNVQIKPDQAPMNPEDQVVPKEAPKAPETATTQAEPEDTTKTPEQQAQENPGTPLNLDDSKPSKTTTEDKKPRGKFNPDKPDYRQIHKGPSAGTLTRKNLGTTNPLDPDVTKSLSIRRAKESGNDAHSSEELTQRNIEKLKKIFPGLKDSNINLLHQSIERIESMEAYGHYCNGMLTICDTGAVGTAYHEGFHYAWDNLFSPNMQSDLMQLAREKYGINDPMELEERLAEDFREFMNGYDDRSLKGILKGAFKSMRVIAKSIFSNKRGLDRYFYDIMRQKIDYYNGDMNARVYEAEYNRVVDLNAKYPSLSKYIDLLRLDGELYQKMSNFVLHSPVREAVLRKASETDKALMTEMANDLGAVAHVPESDRRDYIVSLISKGYDILAKSILKKESMEKLYDRIAYKDRVYKYNAAKFSESPINGLQKHNERNQYSRFIKVDDTSVDGFAESSLIMSHVNQSLFDYDGNKYDAVEINGEPHIAQTFLKADIVPGVNMDEIYEAFENDGWKSFDGKTYYKEGVAVNVANSEFVHNRITGKPIAISLDAKIETNTAVAGTEGLMHKERKALVEDNSRRYMYRYALRQMFETGVLQDNMYNELINMLVLEDEAPQNTYNTFKQSFWDTVSPEVKQTFDDFVNNVDESDRLKIAQMANPATTKTQAYRLIAEMGFDAYVSYDPNSERIRQFVSKHIDPALRGVAEKILETATNLGSTIAFAPKYMKSYTAGVTQERANGRAASYVYVGNDDFYNSATQRDFAETLVHEVMHSITSAFFENDADTLRKYFGDGAVNVQKAMKDFYDSFMFYKDDTVNPYGATNVKEFFSEAVSNPHFRKLLTKVLGEENAGSLDKLIDRYLNNTNQRITSQVYRALKKQTWKEDGDMIYKQALNAYRAKRDLKKLMTPASQEWMKHFGVSVDDMMELTPEQREELMFCM